MTTKFLKHLGVIRIVLPILIAALMLQSCGNDDESMPTSIQITVVNELNEPVTGADVGLYQNEQDWLEENNAMHTAMTDNSGKVDFFEIDVHNYFVDIQRGNITNWAGEIRTGELMENVSNEISLTTTTSMEHYLVGKRSKNWRLTDAQLDGFSLWSEVDECDKDNIISYIRSDKEGVEVYGNVKCDGEFQDQEVFTWSFNDTESLLTINSQGEIQELSIINMTNNRIQTEVAIDFEGQLVPVLFVFETI